MKKKLFVTILCLQLITIPIPIFTTFAMFSKTASAAVPNIQPYANNTGYKYKFEMVKLGKGYGHTLITAGKNHIGHWHKEPQKLYVCYKLPTNLT